jgi:hypothetical protein
MARHASPVDLMVLGARAWRLWAETSMVIGMRMMGMAGVWAVRPDEALRMMVEKPPAFSDAALAGASAVWAGKRPDQIATATLAPLTRKARANRRRLTRAGPGAPKGGR